MLEVVQTLQTVAATSHYNFGASRCTSPHALPSYASRGVETRYRFKPRLGKHSFVVAGRLNTHLSGLRLTKSPGFLQELPWHSIGCYKGGMRSRLAATTNAGPSCAVSHLQRSYVAARGPPEVS